MKFEDTIYFKNLKPFKLEMPFGKFYFLDTFFVSELNEGVHFSWEMIESVLVELLKFYKTKPKLGYISNRVNSYSMDPHTWERVDKEYGIIVASAIVSYNNITFMNATLEKHFSTKSIKRCTNLNEAIEFILNLKELN